jgi:transposase
MRPRQSHEWITARRERALALLERGRTIRAVARLVGCAPSSVKRWRDALDDDGVAPIAGRPSRLDKRAEYRLNDLLHAGPRAHGIQLRQWTTRAASLVIARHYGIDFHKDHVRRILRRIGWDWWSTARVESWLRETGHLRAYPRHRGAWLPSARATRGGVITAYQSIEGWSIEPCRVCARARDRERQRQTTMGPSLEAAPRASSS